MLYTLTLDINTMPKYHASDLIEVAEDAGLPEDTIFTIDCDNFENGREIYKNVLAKYLDLGVQLKDINVLTHHFLVNPYVDILQN